MAQVRQQGVRHPVSFHSDVVEWRGLAGAVWWERIAGFCQSLHLKSSMSWLPPIWWCWWWTLHLPSLPPEADMFYVHWNCCFLSCCGFSGGQYLMSQLFTVICDPRVNPAAKSNTRSFWINLLVLNYNQGRQSEMYAIRVLTCCMIHNFSVVQLSISTTTTRRLFSYLKPPDYTIWISLPLNLQNVNLNMNFPPVHRQQF